MSADSKVLKVVETSGDLREITLSFSHDLDIEQARCKENYEIVPNDVGELSVVAVGKFVTLRGLRLKKGGKYTVRIAPAVKDAEGGPPAEDGRQVEFVPVYEKRKVRVSAVQPLRITEWEKHFSAGRSGVEGYLQYVEEMVAEAGEMGSDIVCLPEAVPTPWGRQPVPGQFFDRLAVKADKFSMYVAAFASEIEGEKPFSTAFIVDREGGLLGKYHKVHLTSGSESIPGETFPVFETDFGKIGIQICFDMIGFSESMRLLALNGAEIVLFPHATGSGCERDVVLTSQAMALQNGLYVVPCHYGRIMSDPAPGAARWFGRTSIVAPDGYIIADTGSGPGIASAVIDLERKRLGHGWGADGTNDTRQCIFKFRRPAVYGGLVKEK